MEPHYSGPQESSGNYSPPSFEAPRFEPDPAHFEPAPSRSPAPIADETPKRRSTVREPAPIVSFDEMGGSSLPIAPAPQPEPAQETNGENEADQNRPRRSGWWSKR
jgi:ribonuclease E